MGQLGALQSFGPAGSTASLERLREEAAFEAGIRPGRGPFGVLARPREDRPRRPVGAGEESRKRAVQTGAVLLGLAGLILAGPVGLLAGAAVGAVLGLLAFFALG
jgi:hypothetical protein